MSTGARGNGYSRSCAPLARSGARSAAAHACGQHICSAAATAMPAACNTLCKLSEPVAWLGRHVSLLVHCHP